MPPVHGFKGSETLLSAMSHFVSRVVSCHMCYFTRHVMANPIDTDGGKVEHKSVYVRFSVEEAEQLQRMAVAEERSLAAQIRFLVKQELQGRENGWSQ